MIATYCLQYQRKHAFRNQQLGSMSKNVLVQLVISPRGGVLDYCNALCIGLPLKTMRKLQLVRNATIRLLTRTSYGKHIIFLPQQLHWLPIHFWAPFKELIKTDKALYGLGLGYLKYRMLPCVLAGHMHELLVQRQTHKKPFNYGNSVF